VNTEDAQEWMPLLSDAGSVFLGPWCAPRPPVKVQHVVWFRDI